METVVVHVFSDIPGRYAFTTDHSGLCLPKDYYGKWKYIQCKSMELADYPLPGLPVSARRIDHSIRNRHFFIVDFLEYGPLLKNEAELLDKKVASYLAQTACLEEKGAKVTLEDWRKFRLSYKDYSRAFNGLFKKVEETALTL